MNGVAEKIRNLLSLPGSHYFNVEDVNGNTVKIRVSDHSANRLNNGDTKTLSFVSQKNSPSSISRHLAGYEWLILGNGLTNTYQTIEEVLEWEEIATIIHSY